MAWTPLGQLLLSSEWQYFPPVVDSSEVIRITQSWDNEPFGKFLVCQSFLGNSTNWSNPVNLFTGQQPNEPEHNDSTAYELGFKFSPTQTIRLEAISYYKPLLESGPHIAKLWNAPTGSLMASQAFTNESSEGWQQVTLANPVVLPQGNDYVISVNSNNGYGRSINFWSNASYQLGDLVLPGGASNGLYGPLGAMPNSSFNGSNYFRGMRYSVADSSNSNLLEYHSSQVVYHSNKVSVVHLPIPQQMLAQGLSKRKIGLKRINAYISNVWNWRVLGESLNP